MKKFLAVSLFMSFLACAEMTLPPTVGIHSHTTIIKNTITCPAVHSRDYGIYDVQRTQKKCAATLHKIGIEGTLGKLVHVYQGYTDVIYLTFEIDP